VLQIILLEGWSQIFEQGVGVAGLWMSSVFFFTVLLWGRYVVGSLAVATVINGYNQEQVAERRSIRREAVKEYRVQLMKREFKDKLIQERIAAANRRPPEPPPPGVELAESQMANRHIRFQAASVMLFLMVQELTKDENLKKAQQVEKFMKSTSQKNPASDMKDADRSDGEGLGISSLKRPPKQRQADPKDADETDMEHGHQIKAAEQEMDLHAVRATLDKMTDLDQELYLREGLNVVDLGKHVATNLRAVERIHEDRIALLLEQAESDKVNAAFYRMQTINVKIKLKHIRFQIAGLRFGFQTGNSLFIFPPLHPVRVLACRMAFHRNTNRFALVIVVISCFLVALDKPDITQEQRIWLSLASSAVNLLFLVELVLKVVGLNFQVYISAAFNRLEFLIVLSSIADEVLNYLNLGSSVSVFAALPIIRSFRILRLLSRIQGLAFIIRAMFSSVVPLLASALVGFVICFLFGLLGLQLLIGRLKYCSDPLIQLESECVGLEASGTERRLWLNTPSHFDWIGRACASVYTISTGAGWNDVMYKAIDATESGMGPSRNNSPTLGIYFVCLVVLGKYMMLTLWTAILVDAFERATIWQQV
jgi:hypothetical protein